MMLKYSCGCTETVTIHKDGLECVTVLHMCKTCVKDLSNPVIKTAFPLLEGLELEGLILEVKASVVKR